MSKAFTKDENENNQEVDSALSELSPLPEGVPNYMTSAGLERLEAEASALEIRLREMPDGDEARTLKRRQRYLKMATTNVQLAGPEAAPEEVRFGTSVTVLDEEETEKVYAIVGVFETEPKLGRISWLSPLAKALLGKRVGDTAVLRLPSGESELEIVKIGRASADRP